MRRGELPAWAKLLLCPFLGLVPSSPEAMSLLPAMQGLDGNASLGGSCCG